MSISVDDGRQRPMSTLESPSKSKGAAMPPVRADAAGRIGLVAGAAKPRKEIADAASLLIVLGDLTP
jgi:hypothetical protein